MNKNIIKTIGNVAVAAGVGSFIGNVVSATLPENVKAMEKVLTLIGSTAVSHLIMSKVNESLDDYIDKLFDSVEDTDEGTVTTEK